MKKRRKLPWMPFFPLDWLGDTRALTNRQKGIWIDLICYMWGAESRGKLTGTWDAIARMVGEPWLECETEIREMSRKNVFEIQEMSQNVTILCRRMLYDENKRESIRKKVFRHREKVSNRSVTRMKPGEVRSQKLEVIKDTLVETAPQVVDKPVNNSNDKDKPLTEIQKVVLVYKLASGHPKDDAGWDKLNFARCAKSAKALIEYFGKWEDAADCVQEVYEKLTSKGLSVTIETVVKHASEWKKNFQEKHPVTR